MRGLLGLAAFAVALGLAAGWAGEAAAAEPPIPAHPRELRFAEPTFNLPEAAGYRHELPGGIPVYIAPDRALPLVDVAVALRGGDYLDPPGKVGLAALTAAMLRRGGTEALTADEFDERADALACDLASSAGSLRAGASLDCPSWVLDEALDLFVDMLRRPRFDPDRLALARSQLADSLAHRSDDPLEVLGREWGWQLYGRDHFSTRPLTPAHLAAIERDDLVAFHAQVWHPGNLVLAISGDVEPGAVLASLARRFAGWTAGEPSPWPPPPPAHEPRPGVYHLERDLPQAKAMLGHLGALRGGWDDPGFFALSVMEEILGGRGAARIAGRLRTVEGLVYRAGASFGVGDHWPGELRVFIEADNANLPRAVALAVDELARLRRQPPGAEELALAKRSLIDVVPLSFDTAEEIAGYLAEDELLGRPHAFWSTYRERVAAVSAEDVRRVAETYLHPDRLVVATVGRWRDIERGSGERGRALADLVDGRVLFLPERDPLTLEAKR